MSEIKPFVFGAAATNQGAFVFQPIGQPAAEEPAAELTDEQAKEEAERETDAVFEPVVHLDIVESKEEEDKEEAIFEMRSKLYRFDTKDKEWKERALGDVCLMQDKKTQRIRILMRQEKILKVRLNHYLVPGLELSPMPSSDRAWMWNCPMDYADDEPHADIFAIRFGNHENALKFKDAFESAIAKNAELMNGKKEEKKEEEKKEEEKKEEEKKEEAK